MKSNEFVCPNCGANLVVNENKVNMKAKERIEALKAAGVDVSNLFAVVGTDGDSRVARKDGDVITVLVDNDPIFQMIVEQGDVPNRNLFRRWVMAQMFHHLQRADENYGGNITKSIGRLGYEYTWKMVVNEFRTQEAMAGKDNANFKARHRWFNKRVLICMATDYIKKLSDHINALPTKKCKGIPYKKINGKNIFVEDIDKKVYAPLRKLAIEISDADTIDRLLYSLEYFNRKRVPLKWDAKQCKEWVDAYKGSGAYFTMQNLIRFHGCKMMVDGEFVSKEESLNILDGLADSNIKGWQMIGVMKDLIGYNGIDIEAKIKSWRKK